jgi:excisionase family DNA binding protein
MPHIQPRICLTAAEAAALLGGRANRKTVIKLINRGELKGKKLGREWRIHPDWLEEYLSKPDEIKGGTP